MSQTQTINTPQDYVNYTFNIEARGVAEVSSELMGLSNTVGNILGQLAFKTSEFLSHTDMLAIGTGAAISAMFVSATQDAIHFQQQIANVQAIGGETINAQAIGDAAMEYSNKFGMATSSMTEGLEALARAGITSTNVMKEVLAEGVKLSKLEGLDLEDSINDLISTTNLLSESGVDMNDPGYGQLVQQMNQHIVSTSESAPINAQNIIQSLQHVGGYASASGMDQEDLFAVIAQLGSRGTKGEMAGTALRAFIAAGQKDTAQRALARIGLNVSDLWNDNGETMLSISEMKDVLDNALEARGYSKQEKLEFYSDFAGYKQANQIMKIDTTEVQQYKESIANAWDLGKKLDVILGTVRGNLDRIWQTTQNFMTKVGSNLLGVMSAILTPVRVLLDVITKIPFADKAVAAGMIFVAFRTGLMIFNKLVPAIGGFMSGISGAKDETRSFRGEWRKTREEVQKTKEIIGLIRNRDQEGLAKKHYEEHGLSARNKMQAERDIAGQMYMASPWYQQHGRIPWESLHVAAQDMILERFKGTKEFKQNYNAFVDRTKANVNEIVSNPIIIEDFEGTDTLEAINVWVQEIFELLNSDRTQGKFGDGNNGGNGPQSNQERNAQAHILSSIFNDRVRGNSYGNVDFKYERSEEGYSEAKAGLKQAYKDLREYTQALSNTDVNNINAIQRNAYKKLFTTTVSERGIEATKTANESEIRLVLEKGVLESHESPHHGIKDSQVMYIAERLGLDDFRIHDYKNNDRRTEFAQAAHEALQNKPEEIRKQIIDELIHGTNDDRNKGTNQLWEDSLNTIARSRRKFLEGNPEIANQIVSQISNINTQGYDNNTKAVLDYFSNLDDSHEDWNIAIKTAMEFLKGEADYSQVEKDTIKYIADNIARHRETILSYQANAEELGFSQGLKDEIETIINDMRNDAAVLRQGGSLLGEAIVEGFVGDGLGRHSPGHMFWALVDEQTDISNAILQSRGLFNKNASLLGLEMTNAFDRNLGINRVFDSGIEFLRRDSDIIKDIIADFDRDEFRTDDEQDLEYDLLPSQQDVQDYLSSGNKTALEHFVRPYGFDMSNYERFGANFGRDWNDITRFQSMMWFLKNDFDFEKMFDADKFDEDAIYDYMGLVDKHFAIDSTWLQLKTYPGEIDEALYANMNTWLEDFYFIFLDTLSSNMRQIISNSEGLVDNVKLYRGGRLPLTGENLGEYLGTTSTSYTPRIADYYAAGNAAVNYKTNVFAPEGVLGVYPNADLLGDKTFIDGVKSRNVYNNQAEYTLGNGQPFIELPNEATGQMSGAALRNEADILLLNPAQVAAVTDVVVDEVSSMINSGRTSSNILNLSGVQAVDNVLSEMNLITSSGKQASTEGKYYDVYDYHEGDRGLIYDAVQYLRYTTNKRVVSPNDLFSLIASVNGEASATSAMEWLNNTYMHEVTNQKGNIQLKPLATTIEKNDRFYRDFVRKQVYADVSPEQIFRIAKNFPDTASALLSYLQPFTDIDKAPELKDFKNRGDFNDKFVKIPYEYTWLLGQAEASELYSSNNDYISTAEFHRPKPTPENAKRIIKNLGIDAFFMPPQSYKDARMRPSVENSYDRMLMGLAYGYLSDMPGAGGGHNAYTGIVAGRMGTEFYGPLQTLNTIIHEFTHMGLDQHLRRELDESDPLYLPDKILEAIGVPGLADKTGYAENYHAIMSEFETNWVATQVLGRFGLAEEADKDLSEKDKSLNRVGHFYDAVVGVNPDFEKYFQWEIYDEWVKVISENIDMFIDIGEEFDKRYSHLDPNEVSQKWDEVRQMVNASAANAEVYMPGSSLSADYMNYVNEQLKAQQEAAKRQQDATAGYKDWYEEQKAEQERMYGLRTEYERTEMGRLHIIQEQLRLEEEGKKNAEENRRKQRERWEQQRKPFEEERKKRGALMVVDQPEEPKSRWDALRDKVREKLGGGYYYFGGERKEREQSGYQKWAQKWAFKGIDYAERADEKINEKSKQLYESIKETDAFGNLSDKITTTIQPIRDFTDVLSSLSEVFPILTPAVLLLNQALDFAGVAIEALTALQAYNTAVTAANTTSKELNTLAEEGNTFATFLNTMAKWQNAEAGTVKNAIGSVVGKATDILADGIGIIGEMSVGTMAAILGPILAVIAAIEVVKFWENKHAEALKETQKALEESTAKNNIALSQYKDLKNARESETNAIKKQQAARKEAIALYELEAARVNRQKSVYDEAKVRNDAIWGEYGERARLQKMGWLESIFAEGIPFLGTIGKWQAGEFESQYEKYDGTTASIRKIKESTLGQLFGGSPEANYVSRVYDSNSMFFAQVEAYKEPLQELYDKESQLIEQYGSIDLARGTKEFEDAVQEFADATNLNGETAGMMLDWLETENRVDQASKVGQAMIGRIQAQTQARIMENEANGQYGLSEMSTLGDAMLYAEFKELMNTAKTESWWNLLHAQLDAILTALNPVNWINGELSKKNRNVEAYRSELETLNTQGGEIYDAMKEAYDSAERREYGSRNLSDYGDTPFGGAIESAGAQYADAKQQRMFARTGQTMSEDQYLATQQQYQEDKFGITNEQLEANRRKDTQRAYQKAQAEKNRKANSTLGQLQFNGDRAHYDALAIINAIEKSDRFGNGQGSDSDTAGGVMGTIIGLAKIGLNAGAGVANSGIRALLSAGSGAEYSIRGLLSGGPNVSGLLEGGESTSVFSRLKNLFNIKNLKSSPIFSKISEILFGKQVQGLTSGGVYATEGGIIPTAKAIFQTLKSGYAEGGIKGLFSAGGDIFNAARGSAGKSGIFSKISDIVFGKQVQGLTTSGVYATEGGIIPTAKAIFQKGKSSLPNIKDILFGKQVEGLAVRPGDYMMEGGLLSKGKMGIKQIKTLLRDGGLKASVASKFSDILYGKQVPGLTRGGMYATEGGILPTARAGLSRLKGAFSGGFEGSSVLSNIRGFASSGNVRGFGSSVVGEMKGMFNPKTISGGLSDVAGGLKGGGTLLKGASKLAGPAAAVLGGAITFAEEYAEHDPSKTHYNEDGTEKKAFQSTGEVVGSTAGSVAGGLGGAIAGAEMGGMAGAAIGSVVPGLGTAIGGAVGTVAGGIIGGIVGEETMRRAGDAIGGTLGWIGDQLYNALPDEAKNAWNTIVGIAGKAWDGITDIAGKAWEGLSGIFGGIWDAVSGAAGGAWNFITGADDTSNNPVKGILGLHPIGMAINAASGISDWLFGSENDPYQNVQQTTDNKKVPQKLSNAQNTVVIKNININTEDDPEKIKSALMNLIIEMQEQINPRQVSRVVGEAPQQTTSTTTDTNNQNQAEGTDSQNTDPNNSNANQNNNNNPTV